MALECYKAIQQQQMDGGMKTYQMTCQSAEAAAAAAEEEEDASVDIFGVSCTCSQRDTIAIVLPVFFHM